MLRNCPLPCCRFQVDGGIVFRCPGGEEGEKGKEGEESQDRTNDPIAVTVTVTPAASHRIVDPHIRSQHRKRGGRIADPKIGVLS